MGCLPALISVTTSLFSILGESHVFFASGVTKVINREDLGLGHVTCCHPRVCFLGAPLWSFCDVTGQFSMGWTVASVSLN